MAWLRRPAGADAAASVPVPGAPPAAAPSAIDHSAPGLKQALERLPKPGAMVLDLGPALAVNVEFFNGLGARVRVADLEGSLRDEGLWDEPLPLAVWERRMSPLFDACGEERYGLVLAWDLPNHVGRERWPSVARELVARLEARGMLHLLARTGKEMPAQPSRYRWSTGDRIEESPTSDERTAPPRFSHGEIERLHPGMAAAKSFLDKHGLQEFLLERAGELNLPPRAVAQPRKPRSFYPG